MVLDVSGRVFLGPKGNQPHLGGLAQWSTAYTTISVVQPTALQACLSLEPSSTKGGESLRLAWGTFPDLVMPRIKWSPSTTSGCAHLQLSGSSRRAAITYLWALPDVAAVAAYIRKLSVNHNGGERGQCPTRVSDGSTRIFFIFFNRIRDWVCSLCRVLSDLPFSQIRSRT